MVPHRKPATQAQHLAMLFLLAMFWSPSFLFIKVALDGFPPVTLGMLRLGLAGAAMYGIIKWRRLPLPRTWNAWKHILLMAIFANSLPFVLFPIGEMYAESGAAAVMNATTPIFTAILAHIFIAEEKMQVKKMLGIFLGFAGIIVMFIPVLLEASYDISTAWGLLAFAAAAACYGASNIIAKKKLTSMEPTVVPTAQFIGATLMLVPVAFIVETPLSSEGGAIPIAALLALVIIGTVLPYLIYYRFIASASATYVSFVTFIMPPAGLMLGIIFLDEQPTWHSYIGCTMILGAVLIVNNMGALIRSIKAGKMKL